MSQISSHVIPHVSTQRKAFHGTPSLNKERPHSCCFKVFVIIVSV